MKVLYSLFSLLLYMCSLFSLASAQQVSWVRRVGGNIVDRANAVTADASGNIYVTGSYQGTLTIDNDSRTITSQGASSDVFIAKFDSDGKLQWLQTAGGNSEDLGIDLVIHEGHLFVVGIYRGTATFGNFQLTSIASRNDVFLARMEASTGNILNVYTAGGPLDDRVNSIALDNSNNQLWLIGDFEATANFGNLALTSGGSRDVFVARFGINTNAFNWAEKAGGSGIDEGKSIALSPNGSVLLAGSFASNNFSLGQFSRSSQGNYDIFLASLNASNGNLNWLITSGGVGNDRAEALAVDPSGNIYITGRFTGTSVPFNGTSSTVAFASSWAADNQDLFLAKYNSSGAIEWVRSTNASGLEYGTSLVADLSGVVVVGAYQGAGTFGSINLTSSSNSEDIFIAKYSPNGQPLFAKIYGRANNDVASDVVLSGGSLYVVGSFLGTNVDFGGFSLTAAGVSDGFVLKHTQETSPCQGFSVIATATPSSINCGESTRLSASTQSGTPPFAFTWSGPNGFTAATPSATISNLRQTSTYSVTVRDANNCSATTSVSVNVIPFVVSVTADRTNLQLGQSAQLNATANGGVTYLWSPTTGLNNPNIMNPVATPTTTTVYTVTVTNANGCQASSTITLQVNNPGETCEVRASATPSTVNVGGTVTLNAIALPSNRTFNYLWSGPNGFTSTLVAPTITDIRQSGIYTITVSNGTCVATATVAVTVLTSGGNQGCDTPVVLIASSTDICPGFSAILSTEAIAGATYTWSRDNVTIPGANTSTYTANEGGIYAVTVVRPGCAPLVSNAVRISAITPTQIPVPTTVPSGSVSLQPCEGSVRLALSSSYTVTPGTAYQWYLNGAPIAGANQSSWNATQAGVYHLEVIRGQGTNCEIRKKSEGIFVTRSNVTPIYVETVEDAYICRESSVKLFAVTWQGSPYPDARKISFRWEPANLILSQEERRGNRVTDYPGFSDSTLVYVRDSSIVLVKPGVTTTFTVTVTDEYGCRSTDFITVNVGSIPTPVITPELQTICSDQNVNLQVTNATYQFYDWRRRPLNSSPITPFESIGRNAASINVNQPGEYVVEVSGPGCPIRRSNIATVRVNPSPTVNVANVAICETSTANVNLVASSTGVGLVYSWVGVGGPYPNAPSISVPRNALSIGSANTFTLTVTAANGCQATTTATVTVSPSIPTGVVNLQASGDLNICPDQSVTLSIPAPFINPLYTYQWSLNGVAIPGATESSFVASSRGTYTARISSGACPASSGSITVSHRPVPVVNAGTANPICLGASTRINNVSVIPAPANNIYSWAPTLGLDNPTLRNPVASPEVTTTYTLTATHPVSGCTASSTVTVVVDPLLGPVAKATLSNGIICAGQSDIITYWNEGNAVGSGNVLYRLDKLQGGQTTTVETGNLPVGRRLTYNTGSLNETTWYILTLTDPDIECVSTCTLKVIVGPRLVATVQTILNRANTLNLCDGSITLRAISNLDNPNVHYQWIVYPDGDDRYVEIPGATSKEFLPKVGGRYSVIVRDAFIPTCFDIADNWVNLMGVTSQSSIELITVEMTDKDGQVEPQVAIPASGIAICQGNCAKLKANYIFNASYQWYRNGQPLQGQNSRELLVCEPGNYQVQILTCTSGFPCNECSGTSGICPVLLLPTPLQPTINHVGEVLLCGDYVELATQNNPHIYHYQWQRLTANGYRNIEGATDYKFLTREAGEYRVIVSSRVRQYNLQGQVLPACSGTSINSVVVRNGIELSLVPGSANSILCDRSDIQANINPAFLSGVFTAQWQWYYNDAPISGATAPRITPTREGRYYVVLSYTNANGSGTCRSAGFFAEGSALRLILPSVVNACPGVDFLELSASVTGATTKITYNWEGIDARSRAQIQGPTNAARLVVNTRNITFGDTLYYRVTVRDEAGCTQTRTVDVYFARFPNPANTRTIFVGSRSAQIEWEPVPGVEYYLIQYKLFDEGETAWRPVADYPWRGTSYVLQGLLPGQSYTWRVASACAPNSNARASEWAQFPRFVTRGATAELCDPVSTPTFSATLTEATIRFAKVASPNVLRYVIRYRVSGTLDWITLPEISQPSDPQNIITVNITGLTPRTVYDVRITTICLNDATDANFIAAFGTGPDVLLAPVFVDPTPLRQQPGPIATPCPGNIQVEVAWSAIPNAIGYQFQFRIVGNNWQEQVYNTNRTDILNFVPNNEYEIRVRAIYDPPRQDAPWSEVRRFITPEDPTCIPQPRLFTNHSAGIWKVYPNPSKGQFVVEFEFDNSPLGQLEVVDMNGRVVYKESIGVSEEKQLWNIQLPTSVVPGIYMLRYLGGKQQYSTKLVIE
ncbi:MAG: fibronectin type III domain-containing protein [Bacteroidia bacterium]|nr:fibronectin type III domain-containing protein [Bacteroidia bacterium]MDW8158839.1 fibronectin type III domain-containing protein [Bacteroidia bacterium]